MNLTPLWLCCAVATTVIVYHWYGFWWSVLAVVSWPIWVAMYLVHRLLAQL